MSGLAFALVLTAAFLHAAWNFLLKRINAGPELVWLFSTLTLIIYLPVAAAVWVIEKPQFDLVSGGFVLGSAVLHLGYLLVLQQGYRRGDLSLVYPTARATGPFLSTIFAVIILGEALTPQVAVGAAAIIGGVFFLTGGLRRGKGQVTTSLLFGVATGALIGTITRSVALTPYALKHRTLVYALWRTHRYRVLGVAIFSPLAYTLVLFAFTFTPVIFIAPLREVSVLLTVLMGTFLLGEPSPGKRLGWAVVIVFGIALLATA